jgi:hypothetical protein
MLFIEKEHRLSSYIKFEGSETALSADTMPKLSVLRIEMERVHPGMSDFIMRVSTPKYDSPRKTGTVLSIRGTKNFAKYETVQKLASTVCSEMERRDDATYKWAESDPEHLADMLYSIVKTFTVNTKIETLRFTTEALA